MLIVVSNWSNSVHDANRPADDRTARDRAMDEDDSGDKVVGGKIQKMVFTSDALPASLDDQARFSLFRDQWNALYGSVELTRVQDRPFSATLERRSRRAGLRLQRDPISTAASARASAVRRRSVGEGRDHS